MEDKKLRVDTDGHLTQKSDYYIEDGKYVFTEQFHIKRGHCCGSGCRNCPFHPKYQKNNTNIFINNG
jgi:hypothetical protein